MNPSQRERSFERESYNAFLPLTISIQPLYCVSAERRRFFLKTFDPKNNSLWENTVIILMPEHLQKKRDPTFRPFRPQLIFFGQKKCCQQIKGVKNTFLFFSVIKPSKNSNEGHPLREKKRPPQTFVNGS